MPAPRCGGTPGSASRRSGRTGSTPACPPSCSIRRGSPGDGARIFLSEHTGDAVPDGLVYLRVGDIAPVAAEFGAEVHDSGARHEVGLVDPDGNRIRVGAPSGGTEPGYAYPQPSGC
jgi:hypothetical protein